MLVVLGLSAAAVLLAMTLPALVRIPLTVVSLAVVAAGLVFAGSRAESARAEAAALQPRQPVIAAPGSRGGDGPLITIVVTAHDDARFVGTCLESVRAQTWAEWECIVVDDASTDGTVATAEAVARSDARLRVHPLEYQGGVTRSRNLGLDMARGQYITFLDADDYLHVQSLEARAERLGDLGDAPAVAGVYCDWAGVPEDAEWAPSGRPAMRRHRLSWLEAADAPPLINPAPLVLTSELRRIGGYRRSPVEDAEMWNRLLRHGYALEPVAHNGVAYRQKAGSRFRSSAKESTVALLDLVDANRRPLAPEDRYPGTPPAFTEAVDFYRAPVARVRRALMGITIAWSEGDTPTVADLAERVVGDWLPVMWAAVGLESHVFEAAMRHEAHTDDGRELRARHTADAVVEYLRQRIPPFEWRPASATTRAAAPGEGASDVRARGDLP